jgi:dihydrofolate reductase
VLSSSPKQIPGTLNEKTTLVAMKSPALLSYLPDKRFSNIYVDGGKVIQSFLKEDLIDELIITKVTELIGTGIPLFGHLGKDPRFEHISTNIYSHGLVKSHYKRNR